MEYQIMNAGRIQDLEEAVRRAIDEGWRPLGGVAKGDHGVAQAMIIND